MKVSLIYLLPLGFPLVVSAAPDIKEQIYKDSQAGVEWRVLSEKMQSWEKARDGCANLGKDWRLPTKEDFQKGLSSSILGSIPAAKAKKDLSFWSQTKFDSGRVHGLHSGKLELLDILSDNEPIIYPVICCRFLK